LRVGERVEAEGPEPTQRRRRHGDQRAAVDHEGHLLERPAADGAQERAMAQGELDAQAAVGLAGVEPQSLESREGAHATALTVSRAMMARWISLVPSPISHSFASRSMRSTGNSLV